MHNSYFALTRNHLSTVYSYKNDNFLQLFDLPYQLRVFAASPRWFLCDTDLYNNDFMKISKLLFKEFDSALFLRDDILLLGGHSYGTIYLYKYNQQDFVQVGKNQYKQYCTTYKTVAV